jgi:hypothetical protein
MIVFNDINHGHTIAVASGTSFNPLSDTCIARVDDDFLLGGVIFQNYTGHSIGLHVAGFVPDWINRDMLWVTFDYPFNQLGCKKLFGQVPETNSKALEFDLKLGFKIITKIDDVFSDGALFVVALDRDDCRWLKMKPRGLRTGKEII